MNSFLSEFISAHRKTYSTNHVLIRLIENWKKSLDQNKSVGAVLMNLSKAVNCIPHDLLIAKMDAYGFSSESVTFFYSYLKRHKQSFKINSMYIVSFKYSYQVFPKDQYWVQSSLIFFRWCTDLYVTFSICPSVCSSIVLHISGNVHYLIIIFWHICKMMMSPGLFLIFLIFWFFGLLGG